MNNVWLAEIPGTTGVWAAGADGDSAEAKATRKTNTKKLLIFRWWKLLFGFEFENFCKIYKEKLVDIKKWDTTRTEHLNTKICCFLFLLCVHFMLVDFLTSLKKILATSKKINLQKQKSIVRWEIFLFNWKKKTKQAQKRKLKLHEQTNKFQSVFREEKSCLYMQNAEIDDRLETEREREKKIRGWDRDEIFRLASNTRWKLACNACF